MPKGQPIEAELTGKILFGERWALIGKVGLVSDQIDTALEPLFAEGLRTLNGGLSCADHHDSFRHGGQG